MSTPLTPQKYAIKINDCTIDVYDIFRGLPNRLDPAIEHAVKKLMNPGQRGAKDFAQDCREAIVSIQDAVLHVCGEDAYTQFMIKLQEMGRDAMEPRV